MPIVVSDFVVLDLKSLEEKVSDVVILDLKKLETPFLPDPEVGVKFNLGLTRVR